MPSAADIIVGTAGWAIAAAHRDAFGGGDSVLERYAGKLGGVEVNSSFYRRHRLSTWARWAQSVPTDFKFAVKMPKDISHTHKLHDCEAATQAFLDDIQGLGHKLGCLLLQLPPSFVFDEVIAQRYFAFLHAQTPIDIVCEPRHPSWFDAKADAFLNSMAIARAAADPAIVPGAASPGGWRGLSYFRLHGSPHMYRSAYAGPRLSDYARNLKADADDGRRVWCMFDNTASSAATSDALALSDMLMPMPIRMDPDRAGAA